MYKYNLLHRINKLPYSLGKKFNKEAHKQLGVHSATLQNWKYIKVDSNNEIRADCLIMIAEFFGVPPKEMYCTPPKKLKIEHETNNLQTSILDYDNYSEIHQG